MLENRSLSLGDVITIIRLSFVSTMMLSGAELWEKSDPYPSGSFVSTFLRACRENLRNDDGEEDFSFWSFQIIDKSPNATKLVERENFWIHKLGTLRRLNANETPVNGSHLERRTYWTDQ